MENHDQPRGLRVNWSYILAILVISCGGIPKGYDEGGYSSSVGLPSFQQDYDTVPSQWTDNPSGLANRSGNITSLGVLGAAIGAGLAFYFNDRFGRLNSWRLAILFWFPGELMQVFASGNYGFLLFARVWTGIGAGALTAITPVFLAEIAGTKARGLVVSSFSIILLSWFSIGYFISYAAGKNLPADSRVQYRIVQAIPMIPTGLAWFASFAIQESPRWLVSKDRTHEAQHALARLRNLPPSSPAIQHELSFLRTYTQTTNFAFQHNGGPLGLFKELFLLRTLRKRLLIALSLQLVAQWSGGQAISYYIPQIFDYAGLTSPSTDLLSSGIYGLTKLLVTVLISVLLIDLLGRRPCLLTGLFLQVCAHTYLAVYTGLRPADNSSAGNAAIAAVFIFAVGYSVGLCTIQHLYASEIFPTRVRGFAYAMTTSTCWIFQFALVKAIPVMFVNLHVWGAFAFFACVSAVGLVVLGLAAPETKGVVVERMDELFEGRWYLAFRVKASRLSGAEVSGDLELEGEKEDKAVHVERAPSAT